MAKSLYIRLEVYYFWGEVMDKNEKERHLLLKWGAENAAAYQFQPIDQSGNSYFIQREEDTNKNSYIREYGFETLPELVEELDVLWEADEMMSSIKRVAAIAALKNKPSKATQYTTVEEDKKGTESKLPAFIYNF